ncbi:MAG: hypothetical protein J2P17_00805 [Mycobacterium sp.]|nr:hypothetical protein [Mycobacterium sp.]
MINFIKNLWAKQPVRTALYTILSAVVGLLVVQGGLDSNLTEIITGVLALLFGVPVTEAVQRQAAKAAAKS